MATPREAGWRHLKTKLLHRRDEREALIRGKPLTKCRLRDNLKKVLFPEVAGKDVRVCIVCFAE